MRIDYWHSYEEGGCYHLYNRCISEVNLFDSEEMCNFFLNKFQKYMSPYMYLYGHCLMPNHFHLLVRLMTEEEIDKKSIDWNESKAMKSYAQNDVDLNALVEDQTRRLFSSLVLRFNKITKRRGPIFSERLKRILQQSDFQIVNKLCYIHHNPIHHGFTAEYGSWRNSSYNSYIKNEFSSPGKREFLMRFFGNKDLEAIADFVKTHEDFKAAQAAQRF